MIWWFAQELLSLRDLREISLISTNVCIEFRMQMKVSVAAEKLACQDMGFLMKCP